MDARLIATLCARTNIFFDEALASNKTYGQYHQYILDNFKHLNLQASYSKTRLATHISWPCWQKQIVHRANPDNPNEEEQEWALAEKKRWTAKVNIVPFLPPPAYDDSRSTKTRGVQKPKQPEQEPIFSWDVEEGEDINDVDEDEDDESLPDTIVLESSSSSFVVEVEDSQKEDKSASGDSPDDHDHDHAYYYISDSDLDMDLEETEFVTAPSSPVPVYISLGIPPSTQINPNPHKRPYSPSPSPPSSFTPSPPHQQTNTKRPRLLSPIPPKHTHYHPYTKFLPTIPPTNYPPLTDSYTTLPIRQHLILVQEQLRELTRVQERQLGCMYALQRRLEGVVGLEEVRMRRERELATVGDGRFCEEGGRGRGGW